MSLPKPTSKSSMPNSSINRGTVHPLADSPMLEFPLEEHSFIPGKPDPEKCAICQRMRALHAESDTVNPFAGILTQDGPMPSDTAAKQRVRQPACQAAP